MNFYAAIPKQFYLSVTISSVWQECFA